MDHLPWCHVHKVYRCFQSHTASTSKLIIVWKLVSTLNIGHQVNYTNYIKFDKLYIYRLSILNNINKIVYIYCTKYFIFSYTVLL